MGRFFFLLVAMVAMLFASQKAVIIFDASGSMWGQIDGKPKISIAKDALKSVVNGWNPNVELGLTVYGHRRKGDCNDIERVVPIGKVDKRRIIGAVKAISPKGKTPIAKSIEQVANELRSNEDSSTIILISDGKESCGANPCEVAKRLKNEGVNFVAHVIGFNVDKSTSKELQCIADATGGEYFSAKNASALNSALKTIVKKVEKPKPIDVKLWLNGYYKIAKGKGQNAIGGIQWSVSKDGKEIYSNRDYVVDPEVGVKNGDKVRIKASLDYTDPGASVTKEYKATAKERQKVVLYLPSGMAVIDASEQKGGKKLSDVVFSIYPVKGAEADKTSSMSCASIQSRLFCEYMLIPGEYEIKAHYNKSGAEASTKVKIEDGKETPVHIYLTQSGKIEVSASETEGGKWIRLNCRAYNEDKSDSWGIFPDKKRAGMVQVPVGKYSLNCSYNAFKKKDIPLEVKAGETTKVHVVMGSTGKIEVSASETKDGKWIHLNCRAYNEDKSDSWGIFPDKKRAGMVQVPVGKYSLNCSYNAFKKKDIPLEVKAGETTKVHVIFNPFVISAKCKEANAKIHYEIYASSGQLIREKNAKCSDSVKFTLDSGKYRVEAKVGNTLQKANFSVDAGMNTLTIDMTEVKGAQAKEELIKADTPSSTTNAQEVEKKQQKIGAMLNQAKEFMSEEDKKKLKEASKMLGNLLGEGKESNKKADDEFNKMSKDLEMFSK